MIDLAPGSASSFALVRLLTSLLCMYLLPSLYVLYFLFCTTTALRKPFLTCPSRAVASTPSWWGLSLSLSCRDRDCDCAERRVVLETMRTGSKHVPSAGLCVARCRPLECLSGGRPSLVALSSSARGGHSCRVLGVVLHRVFKLYTVQSVLCIPYYCTCSTVHTILYV